MWEYTATVITVCYIDGTLWFYLYWTMDLKDITLAINAYFVLAVVPIPVSCNIDYTLMTCFVCDRWFAELSDS